MGSLFMPRIVDRMRRMGNDPDLDHSHILLTYIRVYNVYHIMYIWAYIISTYSSTHQSVFPSIFPSIHKSCHTHIQGRPSPKPMMHIEYTPYLRKIYKFPPIFV